MAKRANQSNMRILVVLAALLWLCAAVISIYNSFSNGQVFYVPELVLIAVTSLILLGWSASIHHVPHFAGKIGYLSILISIANLLALAMTGSPIHTASGIVNTVLMQYPQSLFTVVPAISFYLAYAAAALGIVGGALLVKNGK